MTEIRCLPEDSDLPPSRAPPPAAASDLMSDDDRSVAADSWSVRSEYGSTLDEDQRQADATEALTGVNEPAASSDYSSDKDEPDANEVEGSLLGLQSYWDAAYAEDLVNFNEHGHAGEIWFGDEIMDTVVTWTKNLCARIFQSHKAGHNSCYTFDTGEPSEEDLSTCSVLDIGTGNGLLLQELAKNGFSDLTGTDYSEAAVLLARNLAIRNGFKKIRLSVDDALATKLNRKFQLVLDKGTLDAIGLHPDGPVKRELYWQSVSSLVAPGGILVITSCNSTKDELLQEIETFNQKRLGNKGSDIAAQTTLFQYLDHVRTYPTFMFGGVEGSRVCTVAFRLSLNI